MVGCQLAASLGTDGPRDADETWAVTTTRDRTNGAPCLGVAVLAASALWLGLGSSLAFLVF